MKRISQYLEDKNFVDWIFNPTPELESWISQSKIDADTGLQRIGERRLQMNPEAEDAHKNYPSISTGK